MAEVDIECGLPGNTFRAEEGSMHRLGVFVLGLCIFPSVQWDQKAEHRLPVSRDEIQRAAHERAPYQQQMEERSRRDLFPDDDLAISLAGNRAVAIVNVVNFTTNLPIDVITLHSIEVLRGDLPQIFPTVDYGGPSKHSATPPLLPEWGFMRVQAKEGGKFLVAVERVRPPETPAVAGEYYTKGALDLQGDEAKWLASIQRFLALDARSEKEGGGAFVEGLKDDSSIVRRCALWKLSKLCAPESACWNAGIEALTEMLRNGDEVRREEAINGFETLLIRSFGIKLTFELGSGRSRLMKEMNELGPLDFSIDKDVAARFFRMGNVVVRSRGPERVYASAGGQKVRAALEAELTDTDLAIGDEAFSLLAFLRNGSPESQGKCVFIVPAVRQSFDYARELLKEWPASIAPLRHWSACGHTR